MAEMIGNGTASQAEREDRKEQRASLPAKVSDADDFDEAAPSSCRPTRLTAG
jgi:hypothetical protein